MLLIFYNHLIFSFLSLFPSLSSSLITPSTLTPPFVAGLVEVEVLSLEDVNELLALGVANRKVLIGLCIGLYNTLQLLIA